MFSTGSTNSISFATVTPSFVMCGAPNFFVDYNIATFRSQGYFNSICQGINASFQAIAGRQIKVYFLCHDFSFLSIR